MWTHYAYAHQGIVVEFETENDSDFFKDLMEVKYSDSPPAFRENSMRVSEICECKGQDSRLEEELRVFGGKGLRKINPKAVIGIIYGHRFPEACSMTDFKEKSGKGDLTEEPGMGKCIYELDRLFWKGSEPDSFMRKFPHINFYMMKSKKEEYLLERSPEFTKPL